MKHFISLALIASLTVSVYSYAKDKKDADETTTSESAPVIVVCDELKEKIETILPVQEKINQEFAKVTDQMLCGAMSQQCEYFYKVAKHYEREYRSQCQKGYELKSLTACDYESNGCPKFEEAGSAAKSGGKHRS